MMAGIESQVEKKLQRLLQNTTPVGGCLLYKFGKHKGGYGRYHITYPHPKPGYPKLEAYMTSSRAAYILYHRRPDLIGNGTDQVSHLCSVSRCVNIEHLHLESQSTNEWRKRCQALGECQGCDPMCLFPTLCFPTEHVQSGLIHGAKPKPLMYQHPYI